MDDAIAVVGIACRFPQAPTPEALWRLLRDGESAITNAPPDRWDTGYSGSEDGHLGVMKNYPPRFKADTVALYESRPEATIRTVTGPGVNPQTLWN
ncbi:beta-ketoacyl synthase N-terminal-like domain-containing protein [Streptomyces scopuliridis]|uniref:beta-ketoacyl synthase N-terminal-like domain-containing protein n=1 Tax=Streptomyces scopuliridis TaxID=452529 RepID=UPI0036C0686D